MVWPYNRPLKGRISSLLYDRKLLVLLLRLSLNICSDLRLVLFLAKYLRFRVRKIVPEEVKRRKESLPSGKSLVWSLSSKNLIHTDIEGVIR